MKWTIIRDAVKKAGTALWIFLWATFWLPLDLVGTAIGTTVITVIDLIERILRETYKWAFGACIPLISAVAINKCVGNEDGTEARRIERDSIEAALLRDVGDLLEKAIKDIDSLKTVIDTLGPHQNTTGHKF